LAQANPVEDSKNFPAFPYLLFARLGFMAKREGQRRAQCRRCPSQTPQTRNKTSLVNAMSWKSAKAENFERKDPMQEFADMIIKQLEFSFLRRLRNVRGRAMKQWKPS
jgi:hypothetical protein